MGECRYERLQRQVEEELEREVFDTHDYSSSAYRGFDDGFNSGVNQGIERFIELLREDLSNGEG